MSRLFRPVTAGVAFLLICGVLGSANPAFADKSAKVSPADKVASITVTDDKVAVAPSDKVAVTTDDKVAVTTDDKVA
jgi:hypothetical protein